jgi:HEAT repeat protein/S1-C subfamily serine protease
MIALRTDGKKLAERPPGPDIVPPPPEQPREIQPPRERADRDRPPNPEKPPNEDMPPDGRPNSAKVYERVCRSTVLILVAARIGNQFVLKGQGSGTLIDKTNRLVLTNDHVAGDSDATFVFFQVFANGKRIGEMNFFMEQVKARKAGVIRANVVHAETGVDLALVQLDRLPPDAQALPIADKSPAVASPVLSVGHPMGIVGGALWAHTSGDIRQFQQRRQWRTIRGFHEADIILTNSQTNPGDSGGPLVNMHAQLVGVTHGHRGDANALSMFIDRSEVRKLLKRYEDKSGVKVVLEAGPGVGGDAGGLPKLLADLRSADAEVRARAAQALGELGPDAQTAIPALFKALDDRDENVARQAARSLRAIGAPTPDDLDMLKGGLHASRRKRGYAVEALGMMGPAARSAVSGLVKVLREDTNTELRQQAARCLGQIGSAATTEGVRALSRALEDSEAVVREAAADALSKFGRQAKRAVPPLLARLKDRETAVRLAALSALAQIGPDAEEALPKLRPALKHADPEIRRRALELLGRLGADAGKDEGALAALKDALDDKEVSKNALIALARIGPPAKKLARGLVRHLKDEKLRPEAVAALGSVLEKVKVDLVEARDLRPVLDELISLFEVWDRDLHTKAIDALGKIGSAAVTPLHQALLKAVQNDLPNTRYGVVRALGAIGRDVKNRNVITDLRRLSQLDRSALIRDACDKALQRIR